jgi:hypothetical protein
MFLDTRVRAHLLRETRIEKLELSRYIAPNLLFGQAKLRERVLEPALLMHRIGSLPLLDALRSGLGQVLYEIGSGVLSSFISMNRSTVMPIPTC